MVSWNRRFFEWGIFMFFIIYLLFTVFLMLFLKKKDEKRYNFIYIIGFNYIFCFVMFLIRHADLGENISLHTTMLSMYEVPMAMTFQDDLGWLSWDQILVSFSSSLCAIGSIIYLLFHRTILRTKVTFKMLLSKKVIVLIGNSFDCQNLAEDIRRNNKRLPILYVPMLDSDLDGIADSAETEDSEAAEKAAAQTIDGALTITVLQMFHFKKKKDYSIVILPDRWSRTIELLQKLDDISKKNINDISSRLHVTALLSNDLLRFEDLHFDNLDLYPVSREKLLVRNFIGDNLPVSILKNKNVMHEDEKKHVYVSDRPFKLFTVGFDDIVEEFILQTFENTGFFMKDFNDDLQCWAFESIVISSNAELNETRFKQDVPFLAEQNRILFVEKKEDDTSWVNMISPENSESIPDQVLIATPSTDENLNLAMRVIREYRRKSAGDKLPQIIVFLWEDSTGAKILLGKEPKVCFVEANRMQFSFAELIERVQDTKAEEVNFSYNSKIPMKGKDWKELGIFRQESNRAAVWDSINKKEIVGNIDDLSEKEKEEVYWRLAKYEHRRWCAFHIAHGWIKLPKEEITKKEYENNITKRVEERRHSCIVSWDKLDDLPQKKKGILKSYDYNNVYEVMNDKNN